MSLARRTDGTVAQFCRDLLSSLGDQDAESVAPLICCQRTRATVSTARRWALTVPLSRWMRRPILALAAWALIGCSLGSKR